MLKDDQSDFRYSGHPSIVFTLSPPWSLIYRIKPPSISEILLQPHHRLSAFPTLPTSFHRRSYTPHILSHDLTFLSPQLGPNLLELSFDCFLGTDNLGAVVERERAFGKSGIRWGRARGVGLINRQGDFELLDHCRGLLAGCGNEA